MSFVAVPISRLRTIVPRHVSLILKKHSFHRIPPARFSLRNALQPTNAYFTNVSKAIVGGFLGLTAGACYWLYSSDLTMVLQLIKVFNGAANHLFTAARCSPCPVTARVKSLEGGTWLTPRYDAQEEILQKAIRDHPKSATAHYQLGVFLLREKRDVEKSECVLRKALCLDPDYADCYKRLGFISFLKEDYEAAEQAYREALRCNPNDTDTQKRVGECVALKYSQNEICDAKGKLEKISRYAVSKLQSAR